MEGEEEGWWRWIRPAALRSNTSSIPIRSTLMAVLVLYSFSSQFLPIEPYLVPYLTSVKHFTNYQVTVDIFPISVYAQLVFTLLLAPACYYLSHKVVLILGAFGMLLTYLTAWGGQSLLAMQIMQVIYGFGSSARLVFSPYIFLLVTEEEYQRMTSLTTTVSLLSFMAASELSQLLVLEEAPYKIIFLISLSALCVCCITSFFFPKDQSLSSSSSFTDFWAQNQGWESMLKETWSDRTLLVLSLWWAIAFAVFSLVQNYGTNLFDAVDSKSKLNGHILAASQAAGSLGSYSALHFENFATKSGLFVYVLGSAIMDSGMPCLLLETLLQAAVEISGLSIFGQFIFFAIFFFLSAALFIALCFTEGGSNMPATYLVLESES